jgi:hypothetical protein
VLCPINLTNFISHYSECMLCPIYLTYFISHYSECVLYLSHLFYLPLQWVCAVSISPILSPTTVSVCCVLASVMGAPSLHTWSALRMWQPGSAFPVAVILY